MSTGSSGCVFKNVSQLFTCEKRCDSVEARKALLQKFTSDVYAAKVYYVDNDGKTTEENYRISFQLSETQKDSTMNTIHGSAILQKEEYTPIKLAWLGTYLANKNEYKMKLTSTEENIEKDFNLYCGENVDKINFLIKKTDSEDSEVRSKAFKQISNGVGSMQGITSLEKELTKLITERQNLNKQFSSSNFSSLSNSEQNTVFNRINALYKNISSLQLQIIQLNYTLNKKIPEYLNEVASGFCIGDPSTPCNYYKFCDDPKVKVVSGCNTQINPNQNKPENGPGGG